MMVSSSHVTESPKGRPFPVPNATLPFWRTQLHPLDSYRSTPDLPTECDIVIIGSGLSGASTAYHILLDNPTPPSVILLEARELCSGATGRNGGHLRLIYESVATNISKYGLKAGRELALFESRQIYAMKAVVEKENLDCDFLLTRCLEVVLDLEIASSIAAIYAKQRQDGLDFIDDVSLIGPELTERVSGVKGAKMAISIASAQLWPYKFVSGLLAVAVKKGLNLQMHTMVTRVSARDGYQYVVTSRGEIRAKQVVFATNAYSSGVLPQYRKTIIPQKITAAYVIPRDDNAALEHLKFTYGVTYEGGERDHIVSQPRGGVVIGGAMAKRIHDRQSWWNVADDSTVFQHGEEGYFAEAVHSHFSGWSKINAKTDMIWTGIRGTTPDALPHIGAVPGQENQFIIAGFNGAGMPHIFLAGKGIAKMVIGGVEFEETGIPSLMKTTQERLDVGFGQ